MERADSNLSKSTIDLHNFVFHEDADNFYVQLKEHGAIIHLPGASDFAECDAFREWLWRQLHGYYHDLWLIRDIPNPSVIGFVLAYGYRIYDAHCYITAVVWNADITVYEQALFEAVSNLHREYPLHKVFMEVTGDDSDIIIAAEKVGFIKELCRRKCRFVNGAFQDVYTLGRSF